MIENKDKYTLVNSVVSEPTDHFVKPTPFINQIIVLRNVKIKIDKRLYNLIMTLILNSIRIVNSFEDFLNTTMIIVHYIKYFILLSYLTKDKKIANFALRSFFIYG